jgi:signal transduction histidine kinase
MMVQHRSIGVLAIRRVQTARTYNEVDLQTANLLAGQAAIAFENGRLYTSLARVEALREADRLRSEFVSTVSHELRTPLTSIKGYATTLLREDFNWSAKIGQEYLGIISDECDKLMELIDNILEVSKIEAGVLRIRPETTQIFHVIERAISETLRRNPELDLKFISPPAEDLPFVRADAHRIIQVLRNLIGNSIKYSPEGAHITVKIETVTNEFPARVVIGVADQGIGLKPEDQGRVFERFYRVDTGPTRRTEGTGLGLAICRGIIEAHDGQIWVESEGVGKGSQFYFTLPIVELNDLVFSD